MNSCTLVCVLWIDPLDKNQLVMWMVNDSRWFWNDNSMVNMIRDYSSAVD